MFSIITINKNNASGLKKTIESVVSQTFKNYEFIVIDGGSTDESLNILKFFQGKINYYVSEPDNGIYDAMNKGIMKATGKYCLFLNSGDYLASQDILQRCFEQIDDEDIVYGDIYKDTPELNHLVKYQDNINLEYLLQYALPHQATFIKTDLFKQIGLYDENFKIVSDWLWFVKATLLMNLQMRYIDIPISIFDTKGISSTTNYFDSVLAERERALNTIISSPAVNIFTKYPKYKAQIEMFSYSRIIKILQKLGFYKWFIK